MGRHPGQQVPRDPGIKAEVVGHGQVDAAAAQGGDQRLEAEHLRRQAQIGRSGGETAQERGEDHGRQILEAGEGHRGGLGRLACDKAAEGGKLRRRRVEEIASERGRRDRPAAAAQEERPAQMRLQLAERDRQRGLRDMQRLGGRRDAAVLGDGDGVFKLAESDG